MRRVLACFAAVFGGCLFPSLDGLTDGGGADATSEGSASDAPIDVASDGGSDASAEAGMCPPNNDPSLVAYYPFDEGAGLIVHDCSGHGNDAVLSGSNASSAWTQGHVKSAISFVSSNSICVIVSSSAANQSGGPLTATAWYDMSASGGGGYIVGQRHQTGFAWRIDIEQDDAGNHLGFAIGTGDDAGNDDNAITDTDTGNWHHLAAVFDPAGPTQAIYLDGVQTLSSGPASVIILDPIASTIRVGCRGDDTNFFDGTIDDVRVYSRALSAAEVMALAKQ